MYNLKKALELVQVKHTCPHCSYEMKLCEEPDAAFSDGLGWGGFLYICLNNSCPNLIPSKEFKERYSTSAFTRYVELPGEEKGFSMPVYSVEAFTNLVIDKQSVIDGEVKRLSSIVVVADDDNERSKAKWLYAKEDLEAFKNNMGIK